MLIDESGFLMAPLVRRSWAERGCRPHLPHKGRHREKVSVASALWVSPHTGRLRLSYRTIADGYFDAAAVAAFLGQSLRGRRRPVVVLWDGGNMHRGQPIRDLLGRVGRRLTLERLPPYAPTLNPVEGVWGWAKYGRLCNFAARDAAHLDAVLRAELDAIRTDQQLLAGFCRGSELPEVLTLLR